jgi:hypothetical protein
VAQGPVHSDRAYLAFSVRVRFVAVVAGPLVVVGALGGEQPRGGVNAAELFAHQAQAKRRSARYNAAAAATPSHPSSRPSSVWPTGSPALRLQPPVTPPKHPRGPGAHRAIVGDRRAISKGRVALGAGVRFSFFGVLGQVGILEVCFAGLGLRS